MESDDSVFKATPQIRGTAAHKSIDTKTYSNRCDDLLALPVYSEEYGLMGKIDIYKKREKTLIERKYSLGQIFQGQIYQLWAQMLCMIEMGYEVNSLFFYDTSRNKTIPVKMPSNTDLDNFKLFLDKFRSFDPLYSSFSININKCRHCVYCNLCDKTEEDNVYA